MRTLLWFISGAITLIVLLALDGFIFLKTGANGFSARVHPSSIEEIRRANSSRHGAAAGCQREKEPSAKFARCP